MLQFFRITSWLNRVAVEKMFWIGFIVFTLCYCFRGNFTLYLVSFTKYSAHRDREKRRRKKVLYAKTITMNMTFFCFVVQICLSYNRFQIQFSTSIRLIRLELAQRLHSDCVEMCKIIHVLFVLFQKPIWICENLNPITLSISAYLRCSFTF